MPALDLLSLTLIHTALSLVALGAGFAAMASLFAGPGKARAWPVTLFLVLAWVTSITGFFFPITAFTPALGVGVVATVFLAAMWVAQELFLFRGRWRTIYAVGMVASVYFLTLVTVVQAFDKVPVLNAIAPTQADWPFVAIQLLLLLVFVLIGRRAIKRFKPQ